MSRHVLEAVVDVVNRKDDRLIYEDSDMLCYLLMSFTYKGLRIKVL